LNVLEENVVAEQEQLAIDLPTSLQVSLMGEIAPGWEIIQLLLVTIEQDEDGCYIASDDEFTVYGDGDTPDEALQDYVVSLIDYYELLAVRARDNRELLHHLQKYLNPVAK
jgi:hypothetical protein